MTKRHSNDIEKLKKDLNDIGKARTDFQAPAIDGRDCTVIQEGDGATGGLRYPLLPLAHSCHCNESRTNPVQILIADDHEFVRLGLKSVLAENHPNDWEIVAEAGNGLDAIEMGESLRPQVAILGLSMPGRSGLEVTERLVKCVSGIRILIFTVYTSTPILHRVRKAGASACVSKNESPRTLVSAVERVLAGEPFFVSAGTYRPALEIAHPEHVPSQYLLTLRELSVFRLLALGRSNKELAGDLNIGIRTAETHHANVLSKLNCESLGQLVRVAAQDGVI